MYSHKYYPQEATRSKEWMRERRANSPSVATNVTIETRFSLSTRSNAYITATGCIERSQRTTRVNDKPSQTHPSLEIMARHHCLRHSLLVEVADRTGSQWAEICYRRTPLQIRQYQCPEIHLVQETGRLGCLGPAQLPRLPAN